MRLLFNSAVRGILANNPIDEDSPSPCNKIMLKAVHETYQVCTDKAKAELGRKAAKQKSLQPCIHHFTKIEGAKSKDQQLTIAILPVLYMDSRP